MAAPIRFDERVRIGGGAPCFVIAEAGVNHNGDPEMAHALVDAAADAGAAAVKFQTFDPAALASADAPKAEYQKRPGVAGRSQREMLDALTLAPPVYAALQQHARRRGIVFLSSPFDEASVAMLAALDLPAFKIPSGEITNQPMLAQLARVGRPLLMSTGMATLDEVGAAVATIRASGNPPLALFHCVSNYPASPSEANLRAMATLRQAFDVPVGWSDHTEGIEITLAAVALGAELIEKHLTLDRKLPGPDHAASLEPPELARMVSAIQAVEAALGDGQKRPNRSESAIAAVARKSLHFRAALARGAVIGAGDLVAMRPGTGVSPMRLGDVVGRRVRRDVAAGALLDEDDLEPAR